jgi:hypothetical protein
MRITADRRIEVNEGVEVTEAAQKVLEAMQWMLKPTQDVDYWIREATAARQAEMALRRELEAQPAQEPLACERCKQLEEQAYDLLGQLQVANLKWSVARPEQEPPKYAMRAYWEDDGRIGVVATVERPDGGFHLLGAIIDPPPAKEKAE